MHSDDPQQLELLRVCRIGRAQGLKGEVTVQIFTDEPEYRFAPGAVLYTKDGEEEYVVESSRTFKNRWIIKFEGIDDRDASEAANGVVLLVLDATTGQNGMTQAKVFAEAIGITGVVLSKLDGSAKGGIVISVQKELGVPVKLVGLGEGPDDLAPFDPEGFVDGILA